jgi:glycosyltransferase involved in cell wall biosynthesis
MADSLALSAAVVAVSDYVRGQVAQSVDVDLAKVHVVYDGVDTLLFAPGIMSKQAARERLGIPADSKVVLMVARYWPNKRHDLLLQALSQVRGSCPETELLLVGEPDHRQPAYYDRVQHMISELRLEGSVRCLGFQRDIRWAECAADVQVLCSEHEPLGTCILESMALGVPVIISRGSGLSEIVVDGEHGFVVPQGDSAVLAGRLVELLSHEGMRQTFGRQARRLIESRFTAQACADSITAIYQGMCGRSEDRLRQ